MKRAWAVGLVVALVAGAFLAGTWVSWQTSGRGRPPGARKILHWVDPMHPSYKSDKPGIAPDCGMQLEPVYADEAPPASGGAIPAGALKVTAERQQTIGVTTGVVERASMRRALRTVGRVAPDENRVYRLLTTIDGWVKDVYGGQTGAIVSENQLLLTFYSREFLSAQAAYFYALDSRDRFHAAGNDSPNQLSQIENQIRTSAETLQALGMDSVQLAEISRTRKAATDIALRSPTNGYIVSRSVYPRQRFDRGVELYRIVDISRVWVLADVFESDAQYLHPGAGARVSFPYQARGPIQARVSDALPQFDPATRTLKARLEAENPSYLLRPDMLVDVSLDITLPEAVTVSADAVVDSGDRKTVFVDRGSGYFEARRVETGWQFDDRIEIVKGLMPGERIVLSGNFLLDSESRMKMAAMGISLPDTDPVCGMDVDQGKARAAGRVASSRGRTYYFCSDECRKRFETAPAKFVVEAGRPAVPPVPPAVFPRPPAASPDSDADDARGSAFPQLPRQRGMGGRTTRPRSLAGADQPVIPPPPVDAVESIPHTPPGMPLGVALKASMDPVSRIMVDHESATAAGLTLEHAGKTYFFVSKASKDQFATQPDLYVDQTAAAATPPSAPVAASKAPQAAAPAQDPICRKEVDPKAAAAAGLTSDYRGKRYYFCSTVCKKKFDMEPGKYIK